MSTDPHPLGTATVPQATATMRTLAFFRASPEVTPAAATLNAQRVRWLCAVSLAPALYMAWQSLALGSLGWATVHAVAALGLGCLGFSARAPSRHVQPQTWLGPLLLAGLLIYAIVLGTASAWSQSTMAVAQWMPWLVCAAAASLKIAPHTALPMLGIWLMWGMTPWAAQPDWTPALLAALLCFAGWRSFQTSALLHKQLEVTAEALAAKQKEVEFLARHDPLTGLYNRRAFAQLADMELARAQRHHTPTCVLIVDIDHFRRVNQRFGTQSGDLVLKELGALLQRSLRATDLVARLGGEEFIVLLPQTTLDAAQPVAEKIRKSVALSPVMDGIRPINITVSLGLAATQPGGLDNLYKAADLALHEAKRMGRNRVHVG